MIVFLFRSVGAVCFACIISQLVFDMLVCSTCLFMLAVVLMVYRKYEEHLVLDPSDTACTSELHKLNCCKILHKL